MKEFLKKIGRCIVSFLIRTYCKIVYRVKVIGKDNIPKEDTLRNAFISFLSDIWNILQHSFHAANDRGVKITDHLTN